MYGTVRHTVKAWCEGSGSWGTIAAFPKPVWLVGSPCPAGELPSGESFFAPRRRGPKRLSNSAQDAWTFGACRRAELPLTSVVLTLTAGLEVTVKDNSGEVGPIALQLSSPHLTVASLCFLNITFESPPDMEILSVGAVSSRRRFERVASLAFLAEAAGAFLLTNRSLTFLQSSSTSSNLSPSTMMIPPSALCTRHGRRRWARIAAAASQVFLISFADPFCLADPLLRRSNDASRGINRRASRSRECRPWCFHPHLVRVPQSSTESSRSARRRLSMELLSYYSTLR